jgi:hypothetical protein
MDLEGLLQHLKQPATCPYLEPDESSLRTLTLFIKQNFNIILHLRSWCPSFLFPVSYYIRTLYAFIPLKTPDQPNSI